LFVLFVLVLVVCVFIHTHDPAKGPTAQLGEAPKRAYASAIG